MEARSRFVEEKMPFSGLIALIPYYNPKSRDCVFKNSVEEKEEVKESERDQINEERLSIMN